MHRPASGVGDSRAAGHRVARKWPHRPVVRRDHKGPCCFRAAAARCARNRPRAGSTERRGRRVRRAPRTTTRHRSGRRSSAAVSGPNSRGRVLPVRLCARPRWRRPRRARRARRSGLSRRRSCACRSSPGTRMRRRSGAPTRRARQAAQSCRPSWQVFSCSSRRCFCQCSSRPRKLSRHRGSASHPRCLVVPRAGRSRHKRRQPGPCGRRCTDWTWCSSRRR